MHHVEAGNTDLPSARVKGVCLFFFPAVSLSLSREARDIHKEDRMKRVLVIAAFGLFMLGGRMPTASAQSVNVFVGYLNNLSGPPSPAHSPCWSAASYRAFSSPCAERGAADPVFLPSLATAAPRRQAEGPTSQG